MEKNELVKEIVGFWRENVDKCRVVLDDYNLELRNIDRGIFTKGTKFSKVNSSILEEVESKMFVECETHLALYGPLMKMSQPKLEKISADMKEVLEGDKLYAISEATKAIRREIQATKARSSFAGS